MNNNPLCPACGSELKEVRYTEEEVITDYLLRTYKTGRVRSAVKNLVCPACKRKYKVNRDYHAGPWEYENEMLHG